MRSKLAFLLLILPVFIALMVYFYQETGPDQCHNDLVAFPYGGKDYNAHFAPLPPSHRGRGAYPYGIIDEKDISATNISQQITANWSNPHLKPGEEPQPQEEPVSLLTAGAMIPHGGLQVTAALNDGYQEVLGPMIGVVSLADLAIVNLETPIASSFPYSGECMVFNASELLLNTLKQLGFDVLTTANNHGMDQGEKGYKETLQAIDAASMQAIGYPLKDEAVNRNILSLKGIKIGLLNVTLLSNKSPPRRHIFNYIEDEDKAFELITGQTQRLKKLGADYVILFIHWSKGREYHAMPEFKTQRLGHRLIAGGVDMIIGGHPHVIQPIEMLYRHEGKLVSRGTPGATPHAIAYSLGNFSSHLQGMASYGMVLNFSLQRLKDQVVLSELRPQIAHSKMTLDSKMINERLFYYAHFQTSPMSYQSFSEYLLDPSPQEQNSEEVFRSH